MASHTLEKAFQCGEFSSEFSRKPLLQSKKIIFIFAFSVLIFFKKHTFYFTIFVPGHQLVHSGERPHKCLICLKQFKENCSLKRHIEEIHTHNGSRDFVCSICQKTFVTKRILSDHAKIHGNDASKFICYFCKIRFKKRCQVEVHTRNHTHEKPYFCSAASCEYLTSDPSNLRD